MDPLFKTYAPTNGPTNLIARPIMTTPTLYMDSSELIMSSTVTNASKARLRPTVPYSNYLVPIEASVSGLRGYSRNWGDASTAVQASVMEKILDYSREFSNEDRAILLGIARLESGFNPDAAATSTSASGVFQFITSTGLAFGLTKNSVFDADANIKAGIQLFRENQKLTSRKYPNLSGNDRAAMIYALHHDGPSLRYGGGAIGKEKLLPYLERFRTIANAM